MMTREDIRELASFPAQSEAGAISFYFQPQTPRNRAHREDTIVARDLVKRALQDVSKQGRNGSSRADLERLLGVAEQLRGNQAKAKAIFALGAKGYWREFDLPARLGATQLFVNRRFHLKPLAALLGAQPRLGVVLVDRQRARFFDMRLDQLSEREGAFRPLPRKRSDGYAGYDAGHTERRVANEAMQHFKAVAERMKEEVERGQHEKFIVGCHDTHWSEFESYLHPYVKQRVLGHYPSDVAVTKTEEIREQADRVLREWKNERCERLVTETIGFAKGNSRGVTGLRRVLRALQMGEVQTLLLGDRYMARAVECSGCGHIDAHVVPFCALCGRATRELDDVCEAMIPVAIRRDIELFAVKDHPEFDRAGNIAALLRFRADQNRSVSIAAAS
jgi:peptide subunit release factor 1 (eRF1)